MYFVEHKEPHVISVDIASNWATPACLHLYSQSNLSWNFHRISINSNLGKKCSKK